MRAATKRRPPRRHRSSAGQWIIAGVVLVLAASFVLPGIFKGTSTFRSPGVPAGVALGTGLPVGAKVPDFTATNLITGREVSSAQIFNQRTLLFFSEGVSCQACLEQIQGLQQIGSALTKRGIHLMSFTPDPPGILKQAAADYKITTPLISDSNDTISSAFNTLGLGMHATTPGHAFVLVYRGRVRWYRDYWLTNQEMYVSPSSLLAAIPASALRA